MNPKHFSRSFVWSNKKLHNYFKESQKSLKTRYPVESIMATFHRILPITFDDFHIFEKKLHFTLTVLCVLSRRLLILWARHSFKVTIARRGHNPA